MISAASIKGRLKNKAQETGKTFQELLTLYGLERTIYRLSLSRFRENFTLKGGIFLYAVFDGNYSRATTDIDLLANSIGNSTEEIRETFVEIFAIEADDPLEFDLSSITVRSIAELNKYHGVNVSVVAYLERTRIPISIDIGFGDIVYPARVQMNFPVVLSEFAPLIYAYSLCSVVAEKFEAVVSLAYDNSRYKDFYDIYVLATTHDFLGPEFAEAIKETFVNRHTDMFDIVVFEPRFAEDPLRQSRWNAFVRKKKATLPIGLQETVALMKDLFEPVIMAIINDQQFASSWSCKLRRWIEPNLFSE